MVAGALPPHHPYLLETIRAVWKTLELERLVVMGCSMGGAITLRLAADYQHELTGSWDWRRSARTGGGPGVYAGDVHYYSFDWDAREDLKRIDTRKCKVSLLTDEYDYSCTPAMTEAVVKAIPGARLQIMKGMGRFPMIENYAGFRPFLLPELEFMASRWRAAPGTSALKRSASLRSGCAASPRPRRRPRAPSLQRCRSRNRCPRALSRDRP